MRAKRVILLILSQISTAIKNTNARLSGIETAVLKASLTHKYKANTRKTIIND